VDNILCTLPNNIKARARGILNHMKNNDIYWNVKGEIVINNTTIPNSHIIDLIKCSLYPYKSFTPIGLNQFQSALIDTNIPQTLLQTGSGFIKRLPPPGIPINQKISRKPFASDFASDTPRTKSKTTYSKSTTKPKSTTKAKSETKVRKWIWHKI
jgi:hypothetical protein